MISIGSYSENSNYNDQGIRAIHSDKTKTRVLNKEDLTMILNDKTASGRIIGRVLYIDKSGEYVYNQRTERIEINRELYNPKFIYHLLNAPEMRNKIIKQSQGNTQIFVNWNGIKNTEYLIPHLNEQARLEKIFANIDNLITLHQRKYSKKLQTWEQRKLSEFVDKAVDNRGKTPPLDENGTHPLIEVSALGGVHPDYSKVEKCLNDDSFENSLRAYIKEGDILFTTVGSIGLVSLMDSREEAAIAQNIVAFRAKENFVPEYLYALFSNEENQYKATRIVMGAVQPSIKVSQLVDVEYMLTPNVKEQKKIGAYFSSIDNLITLHQHQ